MDTVDTSVLVSIISSAATVAGALVAAWAMLRKRDADADDRARATDAQFRAEIRASFGDVKENFRLVFYRIDQLEGEQRKSNGVKERLTRAEESTKSAHHRIDEVMGVLK